MEFMPSPASQQVAVNGRFVKCLRLPHLELIHCGARLKLHPTSQGWDSCIPGLPAGQRLFATDKKGRELHCIRRFPYSWHKDSFDNMGRIHMNLREIHSIGKRTGSGSLIPFRVRT